MNDTDFTKLMNSGSNSAGTKEWLAASKDLHVSAVPPKFAVSAEIRAMAPDDVSDTPNRTD